MTRNRYHIRYDEHKHRLLNKKKQPSKRSASPETWIETVETAYRRSCGAVLDSRQVRALRGDWNAALDELGKK